MITLQRQSTNIVLRRDSGALTIGIVPVEAGPEMSDAAPAALGAASAGVSEDASRADHVHPASATIEANTAGSGAPNVLTSDESGKVLTNEGVTAKNYHTLPAAAAGLGFRFYCQDSDGIRVVTAGGDTVRLAGTVSIAGGYVESTTVGSLLELVAINTTEWVATTIVGTWLVETT